MCAVLAIQPHVVVTPTELARIGDELDALLVAVQEGGHPGVEEQWRAIEPALARVVDSAIVSVPEAARRLVRAAADVAAWLHRPLDAVGDEAVVAGLETILECLVAYEEGLAVGADRSPVELLEWLGAAADASQAQIAVVLRVSLRTLQRWLRREARIGAPDEVHLRRLARAVNEMRHTLTPAGVLAWLVRPTPYLDGDTPLALVHSDDPGAQDALLRLLATLRYG